MPFTSFHLGPALFLGMLLRKRLHFPTFLIGNVILDVEPLLVLILGLKYPLHGYFHTFLIGSLSGLALGLLMRGLEKPLTVLYRMFLPEYTSPGLNSFLLAGSCGTILHVLLDSPLYDDIRPLYPSAINPFYNPAVVWEILFLCLVTGLLGLVLYVCVLSYHFLLKTRKS